MWRSQEGVEGPVGGQDEKVMPAFARAWRSWPLSKTIFILTVS